MLTLKGMRTWVFAVCSGLILMWNALADQTPASTEDKMPQRQGASVPEGAVVEKPMSMDQPMDSGMMRKGMMKGDVKKSAEKHDKKMREELKKEGDSMPPMPARTPRTQ
jgi:flagellar basal body P-ring protein FlgI